MSKLVWDATGAKTYETGVNQGVLYPIQADSKYSLGVAWNGLSTVTESPSGAEATAIYADNIKYLNLYSAEEFGATVEAYTYPKEFEECDGTAELTTGISIGQQSRKSFGLCYKTILGNDTMGENYGYKLHIIYGCMASPSEKAYQTINDSPEAITFSWEIKTTPVNVAGHKPTATVVIDSTQFTSADAKKKLAALEEVLYGVETTTYDPVSGVYEVGAYVEESGKFYKCKTAVTVAEAFDASKWDEVESVSPRLPLPDEILAIVA